MRLTQIQAMSSSLLRSTASISGARVSLPARAPAARRAQAAAPRRGAVQTSAALKALLWDCDGVILETEELHRKAYNAAFQKFNVKVDGETVDWTVERYNRLQNTVAGGKPKMRFWFGETGWPTSDLITSVPTTEEEYSKLVDELQDYKTQAYKDIIATGGADTRPGVLNMMDEGRAAGLKIAVCSAATKEACVFQLQKLLGMERFNGLDCFLAGDDIKNKKPDPTIYKTAAQMLQLDPSECIVIEDSKVGLQAGQGAGMNVMITTTSSTEDQDFSSALVVVPEIGEGDKVNITVQELIEKYAAMEKVNA